jgi:hypothetical protein
MKGDEPISPLFVGWDVGGWNCDRNQSSRDAVVILDKDLRIVGRSWRGNLRVGINNAHTTQDFIGKLFSVCATELPSDGARVFLAIDTPLGFSDEFVQLVTQRSAAAPPEASATNPYLFRRTERYLFERGLAPLSAVKDMIGSQATKGMHALAKFAPVVKQCGVWQSYGGDALTAIEAYPAGGKYSPLLNTLRSSVRGNLGNSEDELDAITCALIAYLFANQFTGLQSPGPDVSSGEGWIWLPKDAFLETAR